LRRAGIASEALFPEWRDCRAEIKDPGKVIGTNTVTHMQAGFIMALWTWWTDAGQG
jgi:hypothetical protein